MRRIPAAAACVGLIVVWLFGVARAQTASDASRTQIEAGRKLFADTCANDHCHGGSAPDVRDFPSRPPEHVARIILDGLPEEGMPSFKDVFTSEQVDQLVAYVVSEAGAASSAHRRRFQRHEGERLPGRVLEQRLSRDWIDVHEISPRTNSLGCGSINGSSAKEEGAGRQGLSPTR